MRLGLTELLLIAIIALVALGPAVLGWLARFRRNSRAARAEAARRRAVYEAERRAARDFILHRFQIAAAVLALLTAAALVYVLGFRPIAAEPQPYRIPEAAAQTTSVQRGGAAGTAVLEGYGSPACIEPRDGWLYMAAAPAEGGGSVLLRVREDGSGLSVLLEEEGEITGLSFGPAGDIWYTVLHEGGGALCHASGDDWGVAARQVVTQIDGRPLASCAAVAVGPDGRVYFTEAAQTAGTDSLADALRTELIAHTAAGWVYVYDPAERSVRRVLGGVAGAAALALSPDGSTLYAADCGGRCIWAVDADARELTAGGRGCVLFAGALPGYPAAQDADADGAVHVGFIWGAADWLETRTEQTALRGVALRLSRGAQARLFGPGQPVARSYDEGGVLVAEYRDEALAGTALATDGSRLYFAAADGRSVQYLLY